MWGSVFSENNVRCDASAASQHLTWQPQKPQFGEITKETGLPLPAAGPVLIEFYRRLARGSARSWISRRSDRMELLIR